LFTFLTLWLTFHAVVHFSTACSKIALSDGPLCEHRQEDAFLFIDSSIDNVLLQTNTGSAGHFLTTQTFLNFIWQIHCCMTVKLCNRLAVEAYRLE